MKEHPIIFTAELVRAIRDGRKTQTRRVIRGRQDWTAIHQDGSGLGWIMWAMAQGVLPPTPEETKRRYPGQSGIRCPYGVPGDRLWVRGTWFQDFEHNRTFYRADADDDGTVPYLVSGAGGFGGGVGNAHIDRWRPSIQMPRWASRLTLEVVSVRVERVQEISEKDAIAESPLYTEDAENLGADVPIAVSMFAHTWDAINGKKPGRSWKDNPWVWVIEFKHIEGEAQ